MIEKWAGIDYYPDYQVSNYGVVLNLRTQDMVPQRPNGISPGYLRVSLKNSHGYSQQYVSQLVARAFIPGFREGMRVMNLNGNVEDNSVMNLRLRKYVRDEPLIYRRQDPWGRRIVIVETGEVFPGAREVAMRIGGDPSAVHRVLRGERRSHMGLTFVYEDEVYNARN